MPFAANSMRMSSEIKSEQRPRWFFWLIIAIFVSVLVAGGSNHYLSYTHGRNSEMDNHASLTVPIETMRETFTFAHTARETSLAGSWAHFGIGAGMISLLMVGRMMWVSWPFHPIGLVLMNSG